MARTKFSIVAFESDLAGALNYLDALEQDESEDGIERRADRIDYVRTVLRRVLDASRAASAE